MAGVAGVTDGNHIRVQTPLWQHRLLNNESGKLPLMAGDRGEDHPPAPRPVIHHTQIAEPHHHVPTGYQLGISTTILLERRGILVVGSPIDLDDNPGASNAHIHPADTSNSNLLVEHQTCASQATADQRFSTRVGAEARL